MNRIFTLILSSVALLGLVACEGGVSNSSSSQGGGSTQGMEMPVTLSVVTTEQSAQNNGGSGTINGLSIGTDAVIAALNDPNTQYTTDSQRAWVQDGALEPLQQVNNILCYVNQLRTDVVVNETYVALVDPSKCERNGNNNQGQNQSEGQAVQMMPFIVESVRESNYTPQYVSIWVVGAPQGPNDPPADIKVHITITEGISASNPYGQFVLNMAGIATADWTNPDPNGRSVFAGDPTMMGSLTAFRDQTSGGIGFTFFEESYLWDYRSQASVVTDATQSSGYAHTGGRKWNGSTTTQGYYSVAFNPTNVLTMSIDPADSKPLSYLDLTTVNGMGEADGAMCTSRTQFNKKIWRYDLYHAADGLWNGQAVTAGQRVRVNSGFPFKANVTGVDMYGYAGYWGIWAENPPASWDGLQVIKMDFNNATTPTHTLHEAAGKMIMRNKETLALDAKMDGEQFIYNECTAAGGACSEFLVEYSFDGTLNDTTPVTPNTFWKIATVDWTMQPPETPITPVLLDTTNGVGLWSQTMNGAMFVQGAAPVEMVFYRQVVLNGKDPVFGALGKLTLYCYNQCPKPGLTEAMYRDPWDSDSSGNPAYYLDSNLVATPAAVYEYDGVTMKLKVTTVAGNPLPLPLEITAPPCATCAQGDPWGLGSGPMILPAQVGNLTNVWDAWNLAVSFNWETGHNNWNKLSYVTDNTTGDQVAFQPPISFRYTHTTAGDANQDATFDGKTFLINYGGNGDFWGIPSKDDGTGRWTPEFSILDGTAMGPNGNDFVIKAREMELNPKTAPGECTTNALTLGLPDTALPLGISGTPDNITLPAPIPDSESPRVVDGEVVDATTFSTF